MECKKCKVHKVSTDKETGLCSQCIWTEYERIVSVNADLLEACKAIQEKVNSGEYLRIDDPEFSDLTDAIAKAE